ncbi:FF domain protein (macronuclear) [Tetrahymena thermophila SB210]|uniref:FF domain protein n=1 Tax=Tetrahymena thermophila (strain SB210) TaxID=312017 RepID=I7M621_TETTS|nr:FF domain protein [Tetrahymena thermophila SB210]EAR84054.2 FF domain protein [Tetrahymena thermophila SB210]|eukprot:XP_001031717.2 FF domain protein [Tetrahymena thermophila SB210]
MSLVDKLLQKPESATFVDERQFWSIEKASNGQKYYYNKKTKESQWEKPECLKTEEEKENQTDWIECTKQDGRVFYYNTKSKKSQWLIPEELKILRQQQAERRRIREQQGLGDEEEEQEFTISDEQKKEIDQRNFLEMLREHKVSNQMKWDQAQKLMQNDQRWIKIKQISEKKRLFQDYIQKIKRIERQEQQNKSEKAKEDFFKLLEEQNFNSDAKFYKVVSSFAQDPRYKALDEKNRETYFQDFLDRLFEQEQENMKDEKKIHIDLLKKKILQLSDLSTSFRWSEFCQRFKDDESFKKLSDFDKIYIFSDIIQDLQKSENDERRKNKRRNERINREKFRELLKQKIAYGEINHKTKWKNFVQTIKDAPEFLNMLDQPGSAPHELFEDQQDLLIDNHKAMKAEIKQHIKQSGMKVVADITFQEFIEKMKLLSVFDTLEDYLKNFYYHYFIQKAKLKEKETQKKHKKAQRKYLKFLKTLQELNKDSQYKDFQEIITKGLGEEINAQIPLTEREEIFKEYVATLDPNYKDIYIEQETVPQDLNKQNSQQNNNSKGNSQIQTNSSALAATAAIPPIVHNPPQISKMEPSPQKKQQLNHKGSADEGEEGEIPQMEKKLKNKSDDEDGEQEEGEDSDSGQKHKDKKKKKSSHRHREHHSSRNKSKKSRSRSNSRSRQEKKSKKKDKKKKKSHKHSRSNSSSN